MMDSKRQQSWKFSTLLFRIDGLYDQWAKRTGETGNTLAIFYALESGELYTQKQLSEEFLIPKQTLNSIVKDCIAKGYIRLAPSPENHREKLLCLTEAGREYVDSFLAPLLAIEQYAVGQMEQEYGDAVLKGLEKFCEVFQQQLDAAGKPDKEDTQ